MQHGVCFVNIKCSLVDSNLVQQAGYKLKAVSTIIPDLLFSKAGTTVAFLLVGNLVDFPWHRVEEVKQGFQHTFILTDRSPTSEMVQFSIRNNNDPPIINDLEVASLTQVALETVADFFASRTDPPELKELLESVLPSSVIYRNALRSIPGLSLTEYNIAALQLIGSLGQVAACTATDIVSYTDLDEETANQIEAFFSEPLNSNTTFQGL